MDIENHPACKRPPILMYEGTCENQGKLVMAYDALDYALSECGVERNPYKELDAEFKNMIVEWFFSGNWLAVREDE